MSLIISADEIKKTLPGYRPENSQDFHSDSTKIAERLYREAVRSGSEKKVILMSGGTASGKTEYVSEYLASHDLIIFDGTLPTLAGAEAKIKAALKAGKEVEIHAVLPESLRIAFDTFLHRERKMPPERFYDTHSKSRKTLLELRQKYPDLTIRIYQSIVHLKGNKPKMSFAVLHIDKGFPLVEYLEQIQYTQEEIRKAVLL